MTIKQCNSCKYHILVRELEEGCFYIGKFMKSENCELYQNGKINQGHKGYFEEIGKDLYFAKREM